jgi:hypothetical protein
MELLFAVAASLCVLQFVFMAGMRRAWRKSEEAFSRACKALAEMRKERDYWEGLAEGRAPEGPDKAEFW